MATSKLRQVIETAVQENLDRRARKEQFYTWGLKELTVLSERRDPYRVDTDSGRAEGEWLAALMEELIDPDRRVHLRGLHYAIVAKGDVLKPNGLPYTNTEEDWIFLSERAAKVARWLGLVPFNRIVDERNDAPFIYVPEHHDLSADPWAGDRLDYELPEKPYLFFATGLWPVIQPYRIIMIGEKTSLREVLEPIARAYEAELLLPTGDISDTLLYDLANRAANDPWNRPAVVLYFSDFDPGGHHMPTNAARRLQALKDLEFANLSLRLYPAALNLEQVTRLGLPSTPLKETEQRSDLWRRRMGREQTEIDALATLNPAELRNIALAAIAPFHDPTLQRRVDQAETDWRQAVKTQLNALPGYAEAFQELEDALTEVKTAVDAYSDAQYDGEQLLKEVEPPAINLPSAKLSKREPEALFTTDDDYQTATRKLIKRKKLFDQKGT
jgi:hypothetical protein